MSLVVRGLVVDDGRMEGLLGKRGTMVWWWWKSKAKQRQQRASDLAAIDMIYSFLDRPQPNNKTNTPLFPSLTIVDEMDEEEEEDTSRQEDNHVCVGDVVGRGCCVGL